MNTIILSKEALFVTLSQLFTWRKGYNLILVHFLVRKRRPGLVTDCLLVENERQITVTSM